ncbi:MAG: Gfo/Idh/MocA family oxidoreductase [Chloroflexi bacterium]|nr:Gfo/Idh/MocA family oxidoreductase [Chloroflexota bacterium]
MLRLSAIGLETTHGYIYPALINGYHPARLRTNSPDIVWSIFPTGGQPSIDADARIVACYDPERARARQVAEACLIERVCGSVEEATRGVDGVLILSGDARAHAEQAKPALRAGLATFVDKPFAATEADAQRLAEVADRASAPIFCTSALRFAPQTRALRARLPSRVGTPLVAHTIGTGDFESYAVHALEFLFGVWGGGVDRVQSTGSTDASGAQLDYTDGRRAVWQVWKRMAWQFHLAVYGTQGMDQAFVTFGDRYTVFRESAARMVEFVGRRESPVPVTETIEIVRLLEAVRSAQAAEMGVAQRWPTHLTGTV